MKLGFGSLLLLAVLSVPALAFGQQPVAAQVVATPALPDVHGIATYCGALPPHVPFTGQPVPPTGERFTDALAEAGRAMSAALGGTGDPLRAAALYWEAFTLAASDARPATRVLAPDIGQRAITVLGLAQTNEARAQRCALARCLLPRASDAQRTALTTLIAQCPPEVAPVIEPTPVPAAPRVFSLTGEALTAVQATPALAAEIRASNGFLITTMAGQPETWSVPETFRARINAALGAYRRAHPRTIVTPHPRPAPSRSVAGYAVPIGLGVGGLDLGVIGALQWAACADGNAVLTAANNGQTMTGWPRDVAASTANACLAGNILVPAGAALLAGGVTSWFLLAPRRPPVSVAPVVSPRAQGLAVTVSF